MTLEEFRFLTRDKIRQRIEANLHQDPAAFALSYSTNDFPVALVSTQLKYLQKARTKLPSFYQAGCVIPPLSYEQSSSELAASSKAFSGNRCLDLTMGLGVDTAHFALHFEEVIAVEANPTLAEIGRYNMQKLGRSNVHIHSMKAERFLSDYQGPEFDLIYVDPSRRDASGKRVFLLEDCIPKLDEILPWMKKWGKNILIKLSPLFDVREAYRYFDSPKTIEILSVNNECKELVVHIGNKQNEIFPTFETSLCIQVYRKAKWQNFRFPYPPGPSLEAVIPESPQYVSEADVAFYKSAALPQLMEQHVSQLSGGWNHAMGFFFSTTPPSTDFPGRVWQIQHIFPYKPKQLRKWLKSQQIRKAHILRREFPFSVKEVRKQLQLPEGGEKYLICTVVKGEKRLIVGKLVEA